MNELKDLVTKLETKKVELSNKKSNLEKQNKELNSKLATLRVASSKYSDEGTSIEEDIRDLKRVLKVMKTEDVRIMKILLLVVMEV